MNGSVDPDDHDHDHEGTDDGAEVARRRLDHGLHELFGREAPPDVEAAVCARRDAGDDGERVDGAPLHAPTRQRRLAFAAVLLLGLLTVVGVALSRRDVDALRDATPAGGVQGIANDRPIEIVAPEAVASLPVDTRAVELRNQDDDAVAALVRRCPGLEHLVVWASTAAARADDGPAVSITDAAFGSIGTLTKLRRLELHGTVSVDGSGLRELEQLPLLAALTVRCVDLLDDHLGVLPLLPSLRELDLAHDQTLGAAGIAAIARCPGLRRLCLFATPGQTFDAFLPLERLTSLEDLDLGGINVVTRGVRDLETFERFARDAVARGREAPRLHPEPVRDGSLTADRLFHWGAVRRLSLRSSPGLDGDLGPRAFECYPRLRELDLTDCRNVDDRAVVHLVGIRTLRRLRLGGCGVSALSIPSLVAAQQLRTVDFGTATAAPNSPWLELEHVEQLLRSGKAVEWVPPPERREAFAALRRRYAAAYDETRVEQVRSVLEIDGLPAGVTRVECRGLGDKGVSALRRFRDGLLSLELVGDSAADEVTPAVLASLQSFTKLESLTLMNLRSLEARHMFHVGTFPALRRLQVVGVPVGDAALVALGERGLLEDLELVGVGPFGAAGMAGLARCGGLRRLVLPKCMQLDAAALEHVGSMTRLEELDLCGVPGVQGNAVAGLRRCSALRRLRLADVAIPDDALAALAGLRQLQVLDLSGNEVLTAAGLAQLPVSLTELGLEDCPRLDADAAKLLRDRFPRLRVLRVGLNEWLTDDVLRVLVEAPSLERLDVLRCGSLTAASLATIRGASRLRWFRCVGTACIGQQEAAQLRAERPELEIERAVW